MWGKVRMQIPDWNPFVTIGVPLDELPEVVLDTLPEAEGNHPNFRYNFMADVQGTTSNNIKDIKIYDYEVDESVAESVWKSFLQQAPEGAPVPPGKSPVQPALDKMNQKKSNTFAGCECVECNPDQKAGCKCPECVTIILDNLTEDQKHVNCACNKCILHKHPHQFGKPCLCQECQSKWFASTGHMIEYEDWYKMNNAYEHVSLSLLIINPPPL